MANAVDFTFSDLIAGYITSYDKTTDSFGLKTSDDREYTVYLTSNTYSQLIRNLGQAYQDATGAMRDLIESGQPKQQGQRGRFIFAYGIFYPLDHHQYRFEAKQINFIGRSDDYSNDYVFEQPNWWINQIKQLGDFYLKSQFGTPDGKLNIDYSLYRTNLGVTGEKQKSGRQETDTISRLVYGFATAFLMTGDDRYLEAANKGTEYLRDHLRFEDKNAGIVYWYHAVDLQPNGREDKVFASEFWQDFDAIPCYEQTYALAGPVQTYRVTGDPKILADAQATVKLFKDYFRDAKLGGYYSHIDPITLKPYGQILKAHNNEAKKNWNSVGDHAPAYLINLWLGTGKEEYAEFLEETFDTITKHFQDYQNSPFVQEKFNDDWSPDYSKQEQPNKGVIGHNLKIAWNLTRMYGLKNKQEYKDFANKIGNTIAQVGSDRQRGGWYDMQDRQEKAGNFYKYFWHDRKAWWQMEQGILAYYILSGVYRENAEFLRYAREGTAFYNAYFLDHEAGGVYFNVLANGIPYLLGTEWGKGSHSMSGYHSFELCYLAAVYTNLLLFKEPMDFYFKPVPGGFPDRILRVAPDILPPDSIYIKQVWIEGARYDDFDAKALTVKLPSNYDNKKIRVLIYPTGITFEAALLDFSEGVAKVDLTGEIDQGDSWAIGELEQEFNRLEIQQAQKVVLVASSLTSISDEALRYLTYYIRRRTRETGGSFTLSVEGANEQVKKAFLDANVVEPDQIS